MEHFKLPSEMCEEANWIPPPFLSGSDFCSVTQLESKGAPQILP